MKQYKLFSLVLLQLVVCCKAFSTGSPSTKAWKPKISSLEERRKLRGLNHTSEIIGSIGFHHVEFFCGDAKSMAYRFSQALGMKITGETGQMTGNAKCVSYSLESEDFRLLITAPYSQVMASSSSEDVDSNSVDAAPLSLPSFSVDGAHTFFRKHGLSAKAVGVEVVDAKSAFDSAVKRGAKAISAPTFVSTCPGQKEAGVANPGCTMAEVLLYGDVVLRFISFKEQEARSPGNFPFLPHLSPVSGEISKKDTYGIYRIDHAVGNVPNLMETLDYISGFTGFHEFAEFTAEDVGTVESGLNSVVLASNSEDVLLPINEPTGGRRKSQIQTYLEQNEGAGLQHLALKCRDIFETIRSMKEAEKKFVGFELMTRPSDQYYRELPDRLGDQLTQYSELEELGILADADDEGILLQIFTKPIGDRPTFFIEIIQRIGCEIDPGQANGMSERPGCGGFGKGNFRELFKSIEDHEKTLKV